MVNGHKVSSIMLDTGCSHTMVHGNLVSKEQLIDGETTAVRCAHGDTVLYPLAEVVVEVDGCSISTVAAVCGTLPMDVLLGTDVKELDGLLKKARDQSRRRSLALVATTRSRARQKAQEERHHVEKQQASSVSPHSLSVGEEDTWDVGTKLDDTIFHGGRGKVRLSRRQKREDRGKYRASVCPDTSGSSHMLQSVSAEDLKDWQEADPSIRTARDGAERETSSNGVSFVKREGLLHRVVEPVAGEGVAREQLVLPVQCRKMVIELAHSIPLAGHLGKHKTADRVLQRFYWPTFRKDVADYCRRCEVCQKTSQAKTFRAPLVLLPIVDKPFQKVAMDIVGPLPRSSSGNKYVLVLCDYGTRYPEAVPMRAVDAESVAEELVKIFARVGLPGEILTDQGANFTSQLLAEMYRLLHVHSTRTSPYHPQTDGVVERFNQTLKAMLRKVAIKDGKDWDKMIPYVLFAYREVPQSSTGFSPFELLYGREVRGPLDVIKETWVAKESSKDDVVSHILAMRDKMEMMTKVVHENLKEAQRKQKAWYDQNARERILQEGDLFLVLLPTSSNKLAAQWQGPYKVERRVGKVNYVVDMHDRRKRRGYSTLICCVSFTQAAVPVQFYGQKAGRKKLTAWRISQCGGITKKEVWRLRSRLATS